MYRHFLLATMFVPALLKLNVSGCGGSKSSTPNSGVATVIVGGLISSTLLNFFVRPALFWTLGLNAARRVVEADEQHVSLVDVDQFALAD
jgi:hypothetical protein